MLKPLHILCYCCLRHLSFNYNCQTISFNEVSSLLHLMIYIGYLYMYTAVSWSGYNPRCECNCNNPQHSLDLHWTNTGPSDSSNTLQPQNTCQATQSQITSHFRCERGCSKLRINTQGRGPVCWLCRATLQPKTLRYALQPNLKLINL